jgi:hypothetical protein
MQCFEVFLNPCGKVVDDYDNLLGTTLGKYSYQSVYQALAANAYQGLGVLHALLCQARPLSGCYDCKFHIRLFLLYKRLILIRRSIQLQFVTIVAMLFVEFAQRVGMCLIVALTIAIDIDGCIDCLAHGGFIGKCEQSAIPPYS